MLNKAYRRACQDNLKGLFMHEKAYQRAFPCMRRFTQGFLSVLEKAFQKACQCIRDLPKGLSILEKAYERACPCYDRAYLWDFP
jgi:hypothetical protein